MTNVLVAAFGNELRGDDGFGIAVLRRLQEAPRDASQSGRVRFLEVGTAGLWLAQQLLSPCDRLIVIDAIARGAPPGTVYVLKVEDVAVSGGIDMHLAVPSRALAVAKAMGTLPRETFLVGCEPAETEELSLDLTPAVRGAVEEAARRVQELLT